MPINISLGNSAQFIVEFLSTANALTVPSSGTLTIAYYQNGVASTDTLGLTVQGSFFTATWGTSSVDLGPADWSVSAPGVTSPAATGQLRIIADQ